MKIKNILLILIDAVLISLAIILAFRVRFPDFMTMPNFIAFKKYFLVFVLIKIFSYYLFGLYGGIWKYAGLSEALSIFYAVILGSLASTSFVFFTQVPLLTLDIPLLPRSVILIDWFFNLLFIGAIRFIPRVRLDVTSRWPRSVAPSSRLLIVGAGDTGEMVIREIAKHPELDYKPVGFIDDDPDKKGRRIHNLKVLGTREDIPKIVSQKNIDEIIIAIPSAPGRIVREIVNYCQKVKVELKIVPEIPKILKEGVAFTDVRKVKPEDLLGRKTVEINNEDAKNFLQDKIILVTGAGGSIGSEICRQIVKFKPAQLIFYDHNENDVYFLELELKEKHPDIKFSTVIGDIKDISLLKNIFSNYRPHVVFHAAAHKHVPLMEENPVSAVKNNIIGTRNLIYASAHYGVGSFVLISTDKAVNPTSIMGTSKRIAEMFIQAKAKHSRTKFMAVRFGNVIGSSGSVVQLFKKQIEESNSITVTHPEIERYFMTVQEAAQLVIQAGSIGKGGEIFILDMGERIKIVDLAKNLITLSGLEIDKDISIKFVGLRPGEKLYEEILHDKERDQATKHNKIFITQPEVFDTAKLHKDIKELENLANIMDEDKIIKKMKEMVPSYGVRST
ncbi:nucleoside-diphosphate sugar epimerase [Candidatus Desantisbacteria bacterium CG07_land_8_20_14_0_80_39_15]|uniref:Nucleoside-diphosphate sugar epimerase n=1 Tax=Candidatus Desantisbacteria bacterium CG07_land_8_20_14_0_80_39_15 TaxID=1974549 RepID=A0A2M6ZIA7_9BACT|nr:MAG: nucleoside-diphosphate sugar epimerase [Candidatus Desantisbacteria bacterium CG07_land_8_20_14_0_80_39_15]